MTATERVRADESNDDEQEGRELGHEENVPRTRRRGLLLLTPSGASQEEDAAGVLGVPEPPAAVPSAADADFRVRIAPSRLRAS